jgi:hypothetical protein
VIINLAGRTMVLSLMTMTFTGTRQTSGSLPTSNLGDELHERREALPRITGQVAQSIEQIAHTERIPVVSSSQEQVGGEHGVTEGSAPSRRRGP